MNHLHIIQKDSPVVNYKKNIVNAIYSETCLIRQSLGETFCVGIDRVSDYTT